MHPRTPLAAGLDTASIVLFVAIGQREHDQDSAISALIETAAPFVIALAVAWMALRVWNRPATWPTGVGIWAIVVAVGMILRRVIFDEGTAASFVIVASCFLALTLVGWRFLLTVLDRRRGASAAGAG